MSDLAYRIALNAFPKFGPRSFQKLEAIFSSMKEAFYADRNMLITSGISVKHVDQFIHWREDIEPERLLARVRNAGIQAVSNDDGAYPPLLKQIFDPPPLLFVQGELPAKDRPYVAVVGSRKATPYGQQAAQTLTQGLASAGVVIVSGLAHGIDEAAHVAALNAGGTTVAVLACGLQTLSSRQRYLAQKIVDRGGAVVSEFSIDTHAMKQYFPVRNRVISGMSQGTLIVEAAEKSGSLITARSALEQNRDVFAVPGSIFSETSAGTNRLLQEGAHVVTDAQDMLDVLAVERAPVSTKPVTPDSKEEAKILDLLSKNPVHIDELVRTTQLPASTVAGTLSLMEIKGRTKQIGGMYYVLT